tara:strand:- start:3305 stop:3775 length:471 start_codon:yes stop_codon:yes gene_type:complete
LHINHEKKGVSPLIATAILIGFAVVITSIVMMFGTDLIKDIQQKQGAKADLSLGCTRTSFEVLNVQGTSITVRNIGNEDIHAFFIRGRGSDGTEAIIPHYKVVAIKNGGTVNIDAVFPGGGINNLKDVKIFAKNNAGPKGKAIWMVCPETELTAIL